MLTVDQAGTAAAAADTHPQAAPGKPAPLAPGSAAARALYQVWSGDSRVTMVKSPPGGGKTTAVATIVAHLASRSSLDVMVAANTRRQALDLAGRLAEQMSAEKVYLLMRAKAGEQFPDGVSTGKASKDLPAGTVGIRTLASARLSPPACDVLVVDEAWQATFADVAEAADRANQLLMVGDPGQIGPVVTANTSMWERLRSAPHRRAPDVLASRDDATVDHIDVTWRLGQQTVDVLAPLYGFTFTSSRPDRHIDGLDELEAVRVEPAPQPDDPTVLATLVDRAEAAVGRTLRLDDSDSVTVEPFDVAVVCSHNTQTSIVRAMLADRNLHDVAVGTADRMQGGQWHAVVALDPLVGHTEPSPHAIHPGRLCVMASRHATTLTWVHDGQWETMLDGGSLPASVTKTDAAKGLTVRRALCETATA